MNELDILAITRQQLSDAISNFQTPMCDPLNFTPLASGNTGTGTTGGF